LATRWPWGQRLRPRIGRKYIRVLTRLTSVGNAACTFDIVTCPENWPTANLRHVSATCAQYGVGPTLVGMLLLTWPCAGRFIMASGSSGFVPAAGSAPKGTLEHAPPGHGEMMWEKASFSCLAVHLFLLSSMRHCDGDNMLNICASRHRRLLSRCFPLHCLSFVFRTSRSPKVRCVPRDRTQIGSLPNQAQKQRAMLVWSTLVLAVLNCVHGL